MTVYTYQVVADRIEFVGNKGQDGASAGSGGGFSQQQKAPQDLGIPEGFSALEDDDSRFKVFQKGEYHYDAG